MRLTPGLGALLRTAGFLLGAWAGWRFGYREGASNGAFWGDWARQLSALIYAAFGGAVGAAIAGLVYLLLTRRRR